MTSPTRSKEADAVAILRSGGPFAEAMGMKTFPLPPPAKAGGPRATKPMAEDA